MKKSTRETREIVSDITKYFTRVKTFVLSKNGKHFKVLNDKI